MCSRFTVTAKPNVIRDLFETENCLDFPVRHNIAPTQPVIIVRRDLRQKTEMVLVRWGLFPSWLKDPRDFPTLYNARSETAVEKASFRGPIRHRRCLIPASGYYEWTGTKERRQPHLVQAVNQEVVAFAGLWDHWLGADGSELETMTILTTTSRSGVEALHPRMPIIVQPKDFDRWLDCRSGSAEPILDILSEPNETELTWRSVSTDLNNPRYKGPAVLQGQEQGRLL